MYNVINNSCDSKSNNLLDYAIDQNNYYKGILIDEKIISYITKISFFMELSKEKELETFQKDLMSFKNRIFNIMSKYIELSKGSSKVEVAIIGDFSSGKSTFINSFLGDEVCPTALEPTTSSITKFYFSPKEEIFINNKLSSREEYNCLVKHDHKKTRVYRIEYGYPSILFSNINLYDSPGFNNSQNKNDEKETKKLLEHVDAILYLIDVNKGDITKKELERLKKLKKDGKILYCIVNKADLKSPRAVEKIKDRIISYNIFETVVEYSSLHVFKTLGKDNLLKKTFNEIYNEKIPREYPFEIKLKGEKKEGRRKSIYKVFVNDSKIEIPNPREIQKRKEIIDILNNIASQKKPLLQKLLKNEEEAFKESSREFLNNLLDYLNNKSNSIDISDKISIFDKVLNNIFQELHEYEKYYISRDFKKVIIDAYKACILPVKVPDSEKSYWFEPYYKIEFNSKIFFSRIEPISKLIDKYINYIEENINPTLQEQFNFKLKIDTDIISYTDILIEVLGAWYKNLGEYWSYTDGNVVYYDNANDAKYDINNKIKIELDKLMDYELSPILSSIIKSQNKNAIFQKKQVFETENNFTNSNKQKIIQKIKKYIEGTNNAR